MKNLERLKKQNVRSSEPMKTISTLSLENLRQVAGGGAYSHSGGGSVCVGEIERV
jgi:hypothetical protein